MCDPATIGASVLSGVSSLGGALLSPAALGTAALGATGGLIQQQGMQEAQRATNAATEAERQRQRGFTQRQFQAADEGRMAFDAPTMDAAESAARARRAEGYTAAAAPSDTSYLPGQSNSQAVVAEVDGRRSRNATQLQGEAQRRADMEGWADALLGSRILAQRAGERGATEAGFARGSLGALSPELAAARTRGQNTRMWGDLLASGTALAAPAIASVAPSWGGVFGAGETEGKPGGWLRRQTPPAASRPARF